MHVFYVMASGKSVAKPSKLAKPFICNGFDVAKVLQRSCKGLAKVLQQKKSPCQINSKGWETM
jgi:hypothetical protein